MASGADIPSSLTYDNKVFFFKTLDARLNSRILLALLYGAYTGILAVTLWNIFINKLWPIRRAMVVFIILLHALITINFVATWSYMYFAFIVNGQNFWTVYVTLFGIAQATNWVLGITTAMSTVLTDLYMIWYCWMIWGRRWIVVLLPIFFLISATVSKIINVYLDSVNTSSGTFTMLYTTFVLATTLWCTVSIIYRILAVVGVNRRTSHRFSVYQHFLEVFVESSALYSISLIVYLALAIRGNIGVYYLDAIAGIAKGMAPTLIVGRVTTGHRARPDDSWQGSVVGSASIRSCLQEHIRTSLREDIPASPILVGDLEAQREISVWERSPRHRSVSVVADYAHPNINVAPETLPHLRNCLFLHGLSSSDEGITRGSTVMHEATISSQ